MTTREQAFLDFESSQHHRSDGSRDRKVRDSFGLTMTRYLQLLNALLDRPDALAYSPLTVLRLQRIRARGKRTWND